MVTSLHSTPGQLAVLPPAEENRQFRRRLVNFRAVLEDAGVSFHDVQIRDLSERGCRVFTKAQLKKGVALMLKVDGMEVIRARVVWTDDAEAGCAFEEELHQAVVANLLGKTSETHTPQMVRRSVFGLKTATPAAQP